MARPLRIELAGDLHHVTSRGDRREDIFFSEADLQAWLGVLWRRRASRGLSPHSCSQRLSIAGNAGNRSGLANEHLNPWLALLPMRRRALEVN